MKYEDLVDALHTYCDSQTRLPALLVQGGVHGVDSNWLKALGEIWSLCDNVNHNRVWIESLVKADGVIPELMSEEELAYFATLPDEIVIYRGAGKDGNGLCWSMSKEIASRFPFLNRYTRDDPYLHTATVPKSKVWAIKLDRNEQEIVTPFATIIKSESLYKQCDE